MAQHTNNNTEDIRVYLNASTTITCDQIPSNVTVVHVDRFPILTQIIDEPPDVFNLPFASTLQRNHWYLEM